MAAWQMGVYGMQSLKFELTQLQRKQTNVMVAITYPIQATSKL